MLKTLLVSLFSIVSCCNILTLSGGGAYGSFEIGVASKLFEDGKTYDLITGVSAGSINAAYLSTVKSGEEKYKSKEFKNMWLNIKDEDIYKKIYFLNELSMYDNTPLKNTLEHIFYDKKPVRPVLIGATSLKQGKTKIFSEKDIEKYNFTDIILSSTAIPLAFPPHKFLNDIYVDGGLTSNILLTEGIDYCLNKYTEKKIYIDVIVCGKKISEDDTIQLKLSDVIKRMISIIREQVLYSELMHPVLENDIYVTIYEQKNEDSYSMLDFSATGKLYEEGYSFENVNVYYLNRSQIIINYKHNYSNY